MKPGTGPATKWMIAATWVVCLSPTWAWIAVNPVGFWQTGSFGCFQFVTGMVAVLVTGVLLDV